MEYLLPSVAFMLHHTIGRFRQRGRRPQHRGKLQLQEKAPFSAQLTRTSRFSALYPWPADNTGYKPRNFHQPKTASIHPSYRPVLNDTDAGNQASPLRVTFIQGCRNNGFPLSHPSDESSQSLPCSCTGSFPRITVRFHHSQPESAFPEILRTVHTVGIQIPGLRVDFFTRILSLANTKLSSPAYLRTLRLLIHPSGFSRKTVHAGRLQNRMEGHPLTPVQIHITAFLFHLALQNLPLLAEHGKRIGICPVLVGKLEFSWKIPSTGKGWGL